MHKKLAILLIACLLPSAVAAETQPVVKWMEPPPSAAAVPDHAAPAINPAPPASGVAAPSAVPFGVKAEKQFFPLSKATLRPAGLQSRQPYVEKPSTGLRAPVATLPAAAAAPAEKDVVQSRIIHDLFDAE